MDQPITYRDHSVSIAIRAAPETVFSAMIAPSAVRKWWGANRVVVLPQSGGVWAAAWGHDEDRPEYVTSALIDVFEPPNRLVLSRYRSVARASPLPFEAEFVTTFTVQENPEGCRLNVQQSGFPRDPIADGFYTACERGWHDTLQQLKAFAEGARNNETAASQSVAHVTLVVRDYDEAIEFYTNKLGFRLVEDTYQPAQDKRWVLIAPPGSSGTSLVLGRASTPSQEQAVGRQTGGRVFLFLSTDDFGRDYERFRAAGVKFVRPPTVDSYGTVAVFEDLYGNLWDLWQPGESDRT